MASIDSKSTTTMKTLHLKLKPGSSAWLEAAAKETNLVWNYCNEIVARAARPFYGQSKWLTAYDMHKLIAGASKELGHLPAKSIQKIATVHAYRRKHARRSRLSWRTSSGSKRSLGWVPFRDGQVQFKSGAVVFAGKRFRVFDSYGLDGRDFRSGSFSQNAMGDWFFNVAVPEGEAPTETPARAVGLDLGLATIATSSDGESLEAGRWTLGIAPKLAMAQRRGHKRQAKRLHLKAMSRRKDALHKFSSALVQGAGAIYIGDVSSAKLAKTRMAKSVLDSGWGMLKTMLLYKGHRAGRIVEIVNERFTTQACSSCGSITGPKGRTGLVVREWTCVGCGSTHHRDINAARNILARGLSGPSAGTIQTHERKPTTGLPLSPT